MNGFFSPKKNGGGCINIEELKEMVKTQEKDEGLDNSYDYDYKIKEISGQSEYIKETEQVFEIAENNLV